jgi:hypothetical protein
MATTAQQFRIIREGLEQHVWMGAQADEYREIVISYARSLDVELTPTELASLQRRS